MLIFTQDNQKSYTKYKKLLNLQVDVFIFGQILNSDMNNYLGAQFYWKKTLLKVFSCKFCKILQDKFFREHPLQVLLLLVLRVSVIGWRSWVYAFCIRSYMYPICSYAILCIIVMKEQKIIWERKYKIMKQLTH